MTLSSQTIDKELTDLWKTPGGDNPQGPGLQRISTTNLVAYASDHDEGYRVERNLNDLAEKQPGRYILVRPAADPTEPPLRHYLLGHCYFGQSSEKKVCCDLIKLVAQKEVIENLYGFVFSLLLPDLPVEFWWPGNLPESNVFFERMAAESNRVWVDSSKFKNPCRALARLSTSWESRYPHSLLGDLNWIRIQRWQALIAELFDGEWSKALGSIRQVTIEYGEGTQPTRSFFLALWMAGQLGWKYQGPRLSAFTQQLRFEAPQGSVGVVLKPVPVPDIQRDRIFAVGITTGGSLEGLFTVVRDTDPHAVVVRSEINHKLAFSRVASFEHLYSNQLLDLGLKHQGPDPVWQKVLRLAGTVLEKP